MISSPWFAPPPSPVLLLSWPLRLRRPGRRRSVVGRWRVMRERAGSSPGALGARLRLPRPRCPQPWVQRPPRGGAGPLSLRSASVRSWAGGGGGERGGPLVPCRRPPRPRGGGLAFRPRGASCQLGGRTLLPLPSTLSEPDPRAGPRLGPLLALPSSRGAGWLGAAVRVSGQRLVGCGAVGSPPRSLSPPSLPREAARASPSRCIVGGAWVRGPGSAGGDVPRHCPPRHSPAPVVWAVTCAAACVGVGAAAVAGFAGSSASGWGRCARPGGASCWRPHP